MRDNLIALNRGCFCLPLDRRQIDAGIVGHSQITELAGILSSRQNLFAASAVFVSNPDVSAMLAQIRAIEAATTLDEYRRKALAGMDPGATRAQTGTNGLFMGYDFHISRQGPQLIEVNTNAGGAFLVDMMQKSAGVDLQACGVQPWSPGEFEPSVLDMFLTEWRLAGRTGRPHTIAIVDEQPADQYLYPDMLLTQEFLVRNGIDTVVAEPGMLTLDGDRLMFGGQAIDMVYNRLTDFQLTDSANTALLAALLDDRVVVSPAPRHHALFASKRNLIMLTDTDRLRAWGLSQSDTDMLSTIPQTLAVTDDSADQLWTDRRRYFFKPVNGYAGRGAYRGDKLTRRVWADIVAGDYVAQAFVAPSVRGIELVNGPASLKFDVRIYSYAGKPLGLAARVYQGQTTNFRTEGGGFAPVIQFGNNSCRPATE